MPRTSMTNTELPGISEAAFSVDYVMDGETVIIKMRGNGDMEAAPILSRYVSVLHGHAHRLKAKTIRVEVGDLYFLNSSCLKSFASLVALDTQLPPDDRYKIIFCIGLPWQRRTFEALRILGRGLVAIEEAAATS
jgi:hypothetical protein